MLTPISAACTSLILDFARQFPQQALRFLLVVESIDQHVPTLSPVGVVPVVVNDPAPYRVILGTHLGHDETYLRMPIRLEADRAQLGSPMTAEQAGGE